MIVTEQLKCPIKGCERLCMLSGMLICSIHQSLVLDELKSDVYRALLDYSITREDLDTNWIEG